MKRWLIIGLLALLPAVAQGQAGTKTWFIDPDAVGWSDYSSLAAWDAAKARDLTSADSAYIAECMCSGGTASTTAWTASASWGTDVTRDIKVWTNPDSSYRHNGTYQTGNKYRMEIAANMLVFASGGGSNFKFEGLQFKQTAGSYDSCIYTRYGGTIEVDQCIFVGYNGTSNRGIFFYGTPQITTVTNCIFYDFIAANMGGCRIYSADINEHDVFIYNCTFHNCWAGIRNENTTTGAHAVLVRNCISQDATSVAYYDNSGTSKWHANCSNNNSDDGTHPNAGGGGQTGEITFIGEGGDDFHLDTGTSYAISLGVDLSGTFTVDIDGQTRSGWDIGADEAEDAAAAGEQVIMIIGN